MTISVKAPYSGKYLQLRPSSKPLKDTGLLIPRNYVFTVNLRQGQVQGVQVYFPAVYQDAIEVKDK